MLPIFLRKCLWCGSHSAWKKHLHERTIFNKYFPEDIIIDQNFNGNAILIICEIKCKMNSLEKSFLSHFIYFLTIDDKFFGPPKQQIVKILHFLFLLIFGKIFLGFFQQLSVMFNFSFQRGIKYYFLLFVFLLVKFVTHSTKIWSFFYLQGTK